MYHAALGAENVDGEIEPGPDDCGHFFGARGAWPEMKVVADMGLRLTSKLDLCGVGMRLICSRPRRPDNSPPQQPQGP